MKAVLMKPSQGADQPTVTVADIDPPAIGRSELLVEMKACGLCGTDIEKLRGEYKAAMPVLGHEAVGIVKEVGSGVRRFRAGDRVFPHHHVPCGSCYYCKRGNETMCESYKTSNLDPGGFSEFFRVPEWNLSHGGVLKLPERLGFEEASLVEPVACCMRAIERCAVKPGDSVLIVGAGPVGMTHALLLESIKATLMISDVSQHRLEFARRAGRATVFDASTQDVPREVRGATDGRGADIAIAASGSLRAIEQALRSVRKGGKVCIFGVPPKGSVLAYDVSDPYNAEITIFSSYAATDVDTANALKLIASRRVDFASLITHRYRIGEFEHAVETASSGKGMKVVITP